LGERFLWKWKHKPKLRALDFIKYIGPGLLVAVGFIDPGNWASNLIAGSEFGYTLLFVVTLSTIMLIIILKLYLSSSKKSWANMRIQT